MDLSLKLIYLLKIPFDHSFIYSARKPFTHSGMYSPAKLFYSPWIPISSPSRITSLLRKKNPLYSQQIYEKFNHSSWEKKKKNKINKRINKWNITKNYNI